MFDLIPTEIQKCLRFLALDIQPVGSRYTCNPPPTDTDADFLILTLEKWHEPLQAALKQSCWICNSKPQGLFANAFTFQCKAQDDYPDSDFESWRLGELNFIITTSRQFFDRFIEARDLCKKFNFISKIDRVGLHSIFLHAVRGEIT